MLTESFFLEMTRVLVPLGRITIVTDSLAYGTSLCKSVAATNSKKHTRRFLLSANLRDDAATHAMQCKEAFTAHSASCPVARLKAVARPANCSYESISLYRGNPGRQGGHMVSASSYFDRLWTNGQKTRRWFIVLCRVDIVEEVGAGEEEMGVRVQCV